jgi:hypothetical protein
LVLRRQLSVVIFFRSRPKAYRLIACVVWGIKNNVHTRPDLAGKFRFKRSFRDMRSDMPGAIIVSRIRSCKTRQVTLPLAPQALPFVISAW